MSPGELKKLKKYLNNNLWRDYIKILTSKAEYPVIFIFKKNKYEQWIKRWICVNYHKLNIIIKKNQYPLLLIKKL